MKRKRLLTVILILLFAAAGAFAVFRYERSADSAFPYDKLVRKGYSGSEEELIASLVGEELSPYAGEKSAYELACENGFKGDIGMWTKLLTGKKDSSENKTVYSVACKQGYKGSFAQWLSGLCENPEALGRTADGEGKTDYEYACEYGFEGSFIEWMISLISDKEL